MTGFNDGPAAGQRLMLKRAPYLLRVTEEGGKFDALNELSDEPRPGEKLYAYKMDLSDGGPSFCHIRASKPAASGFYVIARYKLIEPQPPDEVMRDNAKWGHWCDTSELRVEWENASGHKKRMN